MLEVNEHTLLCPAVAASAVSNAQSVRGPLITNASALGHVGHTGRGNGKSMTPCHGPGGGSH